MTAKALKRFYDLEEKRYVEAGEEVTGDDKRILKMIARGFVGKTKDTPAPNNARNNKGGTNGTNTN